MNLASGGPGRTLRLLAATLTLAATVAACGSGSTPHSAPQARTSESTSTAPPNPQGTPAPLPGGGVIPDHIAVPAIGVSAPVAAVGETSGGNLASPPDWNTVGWFSPGFRPGAPGHAVLNGHLDTNLASQPTAVFWNLRKLHPGDTVDITSTTGSVLHFTISALNYYPAEHAPLAQIYGPSDNSVLQLVTCAGTWRGSALGYSQRLVVSATLNPGQSA